MKIAQGILDGVCILAIVGLSAVAIIMIGNQKRPDLQPNLAGAIEALQTSVQELSKKNTRLSEMLEEYQKKQPEAKPLIAAELKPKKGIKVKLEDVFPEWQGPTNSPEDTPADIGCPPVHQFVELFPVCRVLGWKLGKKIVVTGEGAIQRADGFEFGAQPFEQDVSEVFKLPEARSEPRWMGGLGVGFASSGIAYGGQLIGPPRHLWRIGYRPSVTIIKTPDEFIAIAVANVGIRQ